MNETELNSRLHKLEAGQYAQAMLLAQVAAFLPAPDVLLAHLTEDSEVSLLYTTVPEEFREEAVLALRRVYELVLGTRRGIAERDLKRLPG